MLYQQKKKNSYNSLSDKTLIYQILVNVYDITDTGLVPYNGSPRIIIKYEKIDNGWVALQINYNNTGEDLFKSTIYDYFFSTGMFGEIDPSNNMYITLSIPENLKSKTKVEFIVDNIPYSFTMDECGEFKEIHDGYYNEYGVQIPEDVAKIVINKILSLMEETI